ncbi:kinase-like domain-containing protein [Roridomyces roridus]|uniref:Kinase-like domain-containing protein n=1 Tax=Roridomyces roridus TaxID=1738132 RepID=A0AAD7FZP0_9AGAR|nr:kinase-like domain-containing protein [Roridomyces roridus]
MKAAVEHLPSSHEPTTNDPFLRQLEEHWNSGRLPQDEIFWREHYSWLKECGYLLRSRYAPGWTAPWTDPKNVRKATEGDVMPPFGVVADATRISDGLTVLIKKSDPLRNDAPIFHEGRIFRKVSSEPMASHPKNRCIQMIEILPVPDDNKFELIVMPFYYDWMLIPFGSVGEVLEFFAQIFEGLQFMHNNHMWHGDIKSDNILMDASPLFVEPVHPWKPRWTRDLSRFSRFKNQNRLEHPVKCHLIDFDLSGLESPRKSGTHGVPKFEDPDDMKPFDPFPVDVFYLGNLIRTHFTEGEPAYTIKKKRGFEFMHDLVTDMLNTDPAKRPDMDQVVHRFTELKAGLSEWKLRSRFASVDEDPVIRIFKSTAHWSRQFFFTLRGVPPIPTP